MPKAVQLASGRYWKSKRGAVLHFRIMLRRYALGDRVPPGHDHEDLLSLVELYDATLPPGRATKAGSGIAYFFKHEAGRNGFSTPCFHICRTDGSVIDFGYLTAIRNLPDGDKQESPPQQRFVGGDVVDAE